MGSEQIIVRINPDSMPSGSDLCVVNAARKSFGKRSDWVYFGDDTYQLKDSDHRLIEFLARGMTADDFEEFLIGDVYFDCVNNEGDNLKDLLWQWRHTPIHDTPFNHCFVSFEVKAPIFVHRHLVKTEYTLCSEFSRRYITGDVEFYMHDYREKAIDKKQGSGGVHKDNEHWQKQALISNERQLELYNAMIADGVAPEQARGQLPLDLMTTWTWSGTLGALAKMCRERLGDDTQKETQYVAKQVYKFMKEYYPVSAKALVEGV